MHGVHCSVLPWLSHNWFAYWFVLCRMWYIHAGGQLVRHPGGRVHQGHLPGVHQRVFQLHLQKHAAAINLLVPRPRVSGPRSLEHPGALPRLVACRYRMSPAYSWTQAASILDLHCQLPQLTDCPGLIPPYVFVPAAAAASPADVTFSLQAGTDKAECIW